jgi:hypothetical protein
MKLEIFLEIKEFHFGQEVIKICDKDRHKGDPK